MFNDADIGGTIRKLMIFGLVAIAAILSAAVVVPPETSNNVVLPTKLMPPALIP